MNLHIMFKKLTDTAVLPTRGSKEAAGYDLYADIKDPVVIRPGETIKIGTGFAMAPKGDYEPYFAAIYARSGMAVKQDLAPANKTGVIDSDYRGEVIVALHNHGKDTRVVNPGDRIAQMVFMPYIPIECEEVIELPDTERGSGGFGSTGIGK